MTAAQDADRPRLFISYRHNDANRAAVLALKQALESEGVDVWLDEEEIAPFGDIFAEMRRGLVEAKAVMAYYCDEYSGRRACQWELTSAMIVEAHEAVGTAPPATLASRLLVVMPTAEAGRLRPKALRGNVILSMQEHDPRHIAQAVRARLASIDRPLGAVARYQTAPWVGISPNEQFQRFVGRLEEMWDIFDALSANAVFLQGKAAAAPKGGTGTARLQSWGGVGKSVLAAHYARTYAPFYPGGVFWLHAGASLSAWQQRILAALRPVAAALPDSVLAAFDQLAKDYPAPDETLVWSRPMIGAALAERGKPYLWIVDDLPEGTTAEQRNAWLAPDERGFGRTLFTTRDGALTTIGTTIALNMLDGDSAYDLLTFSRAPSSPAEEAAARDFLVIVDRYALVIDVAGQLVETHYFRNFAELLETARHPERDARVLAVKDGLRLELPGNANPNIVATLLRSFDFVASLADGETALDILRVASLLAPGVEIPHDLLDAVLGANLGRARHHLVQASLARTGDSGLTIHPVICRAVALTSPQDRLEEIRAHAIAALTRQLDAADDILQLPSLAPIIPHVEVLAGSITTMAVAGLVSALGGYHFAGGRSHLAVPMFDQVYRTYLDRFGPDHPDTLTTMGNLAKALREQGNFGTARQLQQSAWDLSITVRGAEDAETVALKSDLAATLRMQGEFAVARRMCQEVLDTRLRILGPRDRATLACMSNLAGVLRAQGRLKEALELQDRALLICQTDLGEENFQTLVAQNNVSETLRDLGDYPRARELQAAVVGVFERSLGKEHPGTLTAINNLALTLLAERLTEQAHQLFSKALETSRRALGPEHPDTLRTMINLATAEHNLGNDNGAKSLIEETLAIYEKNVGKSHPVTLTARSNYAEILAQPLGACRTASCETEPLFWDRTIHQPWLVWSIWPAFCCFSTMPRGRAFYKNALWTYSARPSAPITRPPLPPWKPWR